DQPQPGSSTFQTTFSVGLHVSGSVAPSPRPSTWAPRNCGQFLVSLEAARARTKANNPAQASCFMSVVPRRSDGEDGLSSDVVSHVSPCCSQRHVVVIANALEHEEGCRALAAVNDQMGAARCHTVGLTRTEPHLLFRVAQEEPDGPLDDVKR